MIQYFKIVHFTYVNKYNIQALWDYTFTESDFAANDDEECLLR